MKSTVPWLLMAHEGEDIEMASDQAVFVYGRYPFGHEDGRRNDSVLNEFKDASRVLLRTMHQIFLINERKLRPEPLWDGLPMTEV